MRERKSRLAVLLAVVLVLALNGTALAAEPGAEPMQAGDTAGKTYEPMRVLGMQVFIDPETGELRTPTPKEAAALSAQFQQMFAAASEPVAVEHKNGMISMDLGLSQMDFSVVRIASDGSQLFDCVSGAQGAAALAETPVPTTLGAPEE